MHVALTDVLTCPRCGPGHGLILVPDEVRERRVLSGFLGCPDCRERYRVENGVAMLAVGEETREEIHWSAVEPQAAGDEPAVRLAALLDLRDVQGVVLLAGSCAGHAPALTALLEGAEVVATGGASGAGISGIRVGGRLPFQSGKLKGVALCGGAADALLEEGARVVSPVARLLLEPPPPNARERLEAAGLRVLAEEADAVLAAR